MLIGNEPPQWATDLLDHWVVFDDPIFDRKDVKAFIYYADYFDRAERDRQVRIFATPFSTALKEQQTGEVEVGSGIYATYIEEGKYTVVATPPEVAEWTAKQVAENQKNDKAGAELCAKPE